MKTYLVKLWVRGRWMTAGTVKATTPQSAIRKVFKFETDPEVLGVTVELQP
jgi:hypothetical protein